VKLNNAILAEEKHVPLYAALVEKHKVSTQATQTPWEQVEYP
jgi:hypothetical protein